MNIAVIDEETGCLIKDSMRVIDKWEPGQADDVQLSNFTFIENRETEDFEIYLCKLGEYVDEKIFKGNAYKYTISLD